MSDQRVRVNTVDAKNRLNELITQVEKTKKAIVVERRGRPVAVVVDYESYEQERGATETVRKSALSKELIRFHERMKRKYPKGTGDSVEILRGVRLSRAAVA